MKVLLAAVQKIELVSDESWLSENLGTILVAIAAVLGASLAAWIANRNHRRQLAHDRHMQGQDHIRELIDIASAAAFDATNSAGVFVFGKGGTEDKRVAVHNKAQEEVNAARNMTQRLRLRLGEHSPIAAAYEEVCATTQKLIREEIGRRNGKIAGEPTMTPSEARKKGLLADHDNSTQRFREECYKWFNESVEQSLAERLRRRGQMWAKSLRSVR